MKLVRFSYKNLNNWELHDIILDDLNLIVGKNATGKSRLLIVLNAFKRMILQGRVYMGVFDFQFLNDRNEKINYITKKTKEGISEILKVNDNIILQRDKISAEIKSIISGEKNIVHPPIDKLVLHIRRDVLEYPHFEELVNWCSKIHSFKFGHIHPNSFLADDTGISSDLMSLKDLSTPLKELELGNKKQLITELNEIGFTITDLTHSSNPQDNQIFVQEAEIEHKIQQSSLSQGMFRSISLLIYINYLLQKKELNVLLVDDLCEGLDYSRSSQLGKMLFKKLKDSNVQFIATTNDYFLMEHVPLKYWNVLSRKGAVVSSLNHSNNEALFKNFKFTGLSNFDFFASDYLSKEANLKQ
jgi:AAA15 family ATPase/GTPase